MNETINLPGQRSEILKAFSMFQEINGLRNLHRGAATLVFVATGGISVRAFFFISDASRWVEVSEFAASGIVAFTWVLIFPLWALAFLSVMTLFNKIGIVDLQAVARNSLSGMALGPDELEELHSLVASHKFRHGLLFEKVIADLSKVASGR